MAFHVLLFAGHMIDRPDRPRPRFPAASEPIARGMIDAAVVSAAGSAGQPFGISGGASGGDILFQEVCHEHQIPTGLYLALEPTAYAEASVTYGGSGWVTRFEHLMQHTSPEILSETEKLPTEFETGHAGLWQRSTMWMFHRALAISEGQVTLIALWDGVPGDGAGGTEDMVERARARGLRVIHLDARALTVDA